MLLLEGIRGIWGIEGIDGMREREGMCVIEATLGIRVLETRGVSLVFLRLSSRDLLAELSFLSLSFDLES